MGPPLAGPHHHHHHCHHSYPIVIIIILIVIVVLNTATATTTTTTTIIIIIIIIIIVIIIIQSLCSTQKRPYTKYSLRFRNNQRPATFLNSSIFVLINKLKLFHLARDYLMLCKSFHNFWSYTTHTT